MDLFEMANQNSENLKSHYELMRARYDTEGNLDLLNKFNEFVKQERTISINMRQEVLIDFLIDGTYKSIYEAMEEIEKELMTKCKGVPSYKLAVEKRKPAQFKSREVFNRNFIDAEKFKYGALNLGGLGPEIWGDYCVVIKKEQLSIYSPLAFVKNDSLDYVEEEAVNIKMLGEDLANIGCINALISLKHENEIQNSPIGDLISLICCDRCYIEAITTDVIQKTHIESVRMSKNDRDIPYKYLFKEFCKELEDEEQRYRVQNFIWMNKLLKEAGIKIEVIDANGS